MSYSLVYIRLRKFYNLSAMSRKGIWLLQSNYQFLEDCALPCLLCECGSRRHTLRAVGGVPTNKKGGI